MRFWNLCYWSSKLKLDLLDASLSKFVSDNVKIMMLKKLLNLLFNGENIVNSIFWF